MFSRRRLADTVAKTIKGPETTAFAPILTTGIFKKAIDIFGSFC